MLRIARFLFLALMLVLLPLRGWAGNVMAINMAAGMANATALTAATATPAERHALADNAASQLAMPADCPMHTQAVAAGALDDSRTDLTNGAAAHAGADASDQAAFCTSCDTCELCLAVANPAAATWGSGLTARRSAPMALNTSFTSAASASNLKPPII